MLPLLNCDDFHFSIKHQIFKILDNFIIIIFEFYDQLRRVSVMERHFMNINTHSSLNRLKIAAELYESLRKL